MDIRKIALWIAIFCGAWSVAALAGVEEKTTSADEETSPAAASKTYIESGPFGFLKIEIPILGRVLGKQEPGKGKEGSEGGQVDINFPPLIEGSETRHGTDLLCHGAYVKIPLFKSWQVSSIEGKFLVPDDDWNPFWPAAPKGHPNTAFLDQPLFCLFDTVRLYELVEDAQGRDFLSTYAERDRWLDTPLVSLWEKETWGKGKYYRCKFLDFLPVTTVAGMKSKSRSSFQVLDTCLAGIFGYDNEGKHGHIRFLSTILASVWENRWKGGDEEWSLLGGPHAVGPTHRREGEEKEWSFLAIPLCGGAKWRAEGEKERLTILGTESMDSRLPGRGGAPKIALWHQNREDKDTSTQQFLRVPLIGPVWAAWEDKEESRWGIFPRLFFWKKFRY